MRGIDTLDLLVNGTLAQVEEEVRRVLWLLGPLTISPSLQALPPGVPPENGGALACAV